MVLTRPKLLWQRYKLPPSRLAGRFSKAVRFVPAIVRKPRLVGLWLLSARRMHFALALLALLLVAVVPHGAAAVADALFQPVTEKKTFLLVLNRDRTVEHEWRMPAYRSMVTTSWVLSLGILGLLFVQHAPAALRLGQRRGRALLAMARQEPDPMESARLYTRASGLLAGSASGDVIVASPTSARQKTMLISGNEPDVKKFIGAEQRYRLDKVMGSGGMGVVHAGFDSLLSRHVACKQLFKHLVNEPELNQRFRQEANALAALSHNHIVRIYDLLEESGSFWIVMELCRGGSFGDRIQDEAPLPAALCIDVVCKIADGLAYAHSQGMVHRDVKPMNILFADDGTPKLADFGNAKVAKPSVHTLNGVTLGSPIYMSPEQIEGNQVDHRSDIYSLGVTLYHAVTGKVPFDGDLGAILAQHIGQVPVAPIDINADVPRQLSDAILVMLAKKPADRFQDMHQVVTALRQSVAAQVSVESELALTET
jgi:hypothetical protein